MLGKLAGLFLLRKTVSDSSSLIESLLAGLAAVAILTVMATVLLGLLILGGVYVTYHTLLFNGFAPQAAGMIVGEIILFLLALVTLAAILCVRKIRNIPRHFVKPESPLTQNIGKITDAFLAGFNHPGPRL